MLPHNAHFSGFTAAAAIRQLKAQPLVEVDIAMSKSFCHVYSYEDFDWDATIDAYYHFFEEFVRKIEQIAGPPLYRGFWDSPDIKIWNALLPEYAHAERLVVWQLDEAKMYLRYGRGDKEIPVLIALGFEGCAETGMDYGAFDA